MKHALETHPYDFAGAYPATGSPRFTNEVQHQLKVLPWELTTVRSPLKSGVK